MTWKELKDKISLMTEEEQQQEVAVWGEYLNLMKDCSLEKTNENMYFNRRRSSGNNGKGRGVVGGSRSGKESTP